MANVWPATQSQLYGELNKLADAGLIEVSDMGPRGRKEYRITEAGREELRRWVTEPGGRSAVPRSAGLLRVFLLAEIPREEARAHMAAMAEHADAEVKRLEALRDSIDWSDGESLFYGRAALEYGLRLNAMEADWAVAGQGHRRARSPEFARQKIALEKSVRTKGLDRSYP